MIGRPHEWILPFSSKLWTWNLNDLYLCKSIVKRRRGSLHTHTTKRVAKSIWKQLGSNNSRTQNTSEDWQNGTPDFLTLFFPSLQVQVRFEHLNPQLFCKDAMSSQPYPWSWVSITSCQTPMLYGLVFCWCRKRRVTTTANLLQQTKLACLRWLASILLTNSILGMHSKIYAIQTNHGKFI